ncbi:MULTISPECIES: hypothetical protein [Caballeronia]|uniref:hypothetical protein n=1 Tax=Caballeronia TaxID=1827195 RepID=UPI000313B1E9|nr:MULTISPECIES: hypothetical protein [unclassified Caballeronia]MCE4544786.1 hypothetical protein [Caballeronia sp. PC1]MCE4570210.1 hypothetical protein [Caballeronia sp. CLC5]BAO89349.1 uncharacterized protein BRPE67_BCDS14350 [Burkholderia sp. RPE67]BBP98048.1 hypothetical protein BSFA1_31770 [Burkholderia sp. SFA1]
MKKASQDQRSKEDRPRAANEEDLLDEALEETFPASDPIAVHPEPDTPKDGKKK